MGLLLDNQDAHEWALCFTHLLDPAVSELRVNGPDAFFVVRNGKQEQLPINLPSVKRYVQGMEAGLLPRVRHLMPYRPDGYLFEGPLELRTEDVEVKGRCHIVLPPASPAPVITIAKRSGSLVSLEAIAARGSMADEMLQFLKMAMGARLTMVFSGKSGAGKTTMLEACTKLIPSTTRIGVAEDTPELALSQRDVFYLNSTPLYPGVDVKDVATLDWCVAQFQRMRPERIIIGETRGPEFAQFLVAANSGMEGSLTTIHASDPEGALQRMALFVLKSGAGQPLRAINSEIASTIDIIVQLMVLPDGRHRVKKITEVTNAIGSGEDAAIVVNPLYSYDPQRDVFVREEAMSGQLRRELTARGVDISPFIAAKSSDPLRMPVSVTQKTLGVPAPGASRGLPLPNQRTI